MWIISNKAFISIVAHIDNPGVWIARFRDQGDAEYIAEEVLGVNISRVIATPEADYAFRIYLTWKNLSRLFNELSHDIDYPNFKDSCPKDRQETYLKIWSVGMELQR